MLKSIAFLDRDGVINVDKGYVFKIKDFEWIDEARDAIKYLKQLNYIIIIVTNQSGIARKYYTEDDVMLLHKYINSELEKINTRIDDFFFSPFHPDIVNKKYLHIAHLRKPNTGMLEIASKKWNIDKRRSFLIGDKETDMKCAQNFGIRGYLFDGGSLLEFVKKLKL